MSWSVTVTDDQRALLVEQRTQGSGRVWFERATGRRGEMIELAARLNELEGRRRRDADDTKDETGTAAEYLPPATSLAQINDSFEAFRRRRHNMGDVRLLVHPVVAHEYQQQIGPLPDFVIVTADSAEG